MSNDTDGIFLLFALAMDNVTFAICIKDNTPSSILVPELDIMEIIGIFFDTAISIAWEIFSPEISPRFPPINEKSINIITQLLPPIVLNPVITESLSPVLSISDLALFSYSGNSPYKYPYSFGKSWLNSSKESLSVSNCNLSYGFI